MITPFQKIHILRRFLLSFALLPRRSACSFFFLLRGENGKIFSINGERQQEISLWRPKAGERWALGRARDKSLAAETLAAAGEYRIPELERNWIYCSLILKRQTELLRGLRVFIANSPRSHKLIKALWVCVLFFCAIEKFRLFRFHFPSINWVRGRQCVLKPSWEANWMLN